MYHTVTFLLLFLFISQGSHVCGHEELNEQLLNSYQGSRQNRAFDDAEIDELKEIERLREKALHGDNIDVNKEMQVVQSVRDDTINLASTDTGNAQGQNQAILDDIDNAIAGDEAILIAVVAGCSIAGLVGLVVAGVCWYRLQKNVKAVSEAEYPAYGPTGPSREKVTSPGDRKLAQSAQMYHYQHQKQQMLAMERANGDLGGQGSDVDSEEENEEGDYTVYECPGLAPTGEMEVKNPLFNDDTPNNTNGDNESEVQSSRQ